MLEVSQRTTEVSPDELERIHDDLDWRAGASLHSGVEYPGRYTRWDIAFIDPPLAIDGRGRELTLTALNARGEIALAAMVEALAAEAAAGEPIELSRPHAREAVARIASGKGDELDEEQRTRRRSSFSMVRTLIGALPKNVDYLGLYGAFGYDLVRQIEDLDEHPEGLATPGTARDIALYLPDSLVLADRQRGEAFRVDLEFSHGGRSTEGMPREAVPARFAHATPETLASYAPRDHAPGEYAETVARERTNFVDGSLFEVVPGQAFREPVRRGVTPSDLSRRLRELNPAPYGAFMNLRHNEFLVAASPEMYVRVTGDRVETVPISGSIRRGRDPLEDADNILALLANDKEKSELTMCTDVDRNDKARVCVPGSVRIIGRRQIELYSRIIHTVDHVEGRLKPGFDGLDAFATHMWAVTVTGAPKIWAMREIDRVERSPRGWYAGAIGVLYASGDVNTGLTIRTAQIRDGIAEVRAGATLLIDSEPSLEEAETELKASALIDVLREGDDDASEGGTGASSAAAASVEHAVAGDEDATRVPAIEPAPPRVLLLDHEDSFVQTLAAYFAVAGGSVRTVRVPLGGLRPDRLERLLDEVDPDLVVLSPGPGTPTDFAMGRTIAALARREQPTFGVCLGMQGLGEHFGGRVERIARALHGKERSVTLRDAGVLEGMPERFVTGRYHSLAVARESFPHDALRLVADDDDGVPMALEHRELPMWAVQFHPESLMTLRDGAGQGIVERVLARAVATRAKRALAGESPRSRQPRAGLDG